MAIKNLPVFIETNILIWGVRGSATVGQEDLILKATNLIEHLQRNHAKLMTSTICLGEFLTGAENEKHANLINIIQRGFMVYAYDEACAMKTAWLQRFRDPEIKTLRASVTNVPGARVKIKNDVMIVATALVHGASVIYTNDKGIQTIAGDLIPVKMLSDYDLQFTKEPSLFDSTSKTAH